MGRVSFTASAPVLFAPLLSSGSNLLCSRPSALQACSVSPGVACFPFLLLSSGGLPLRHILGDCLLLQFVSGNKTNPSSVDQLALALLKVLHDGVIYETKHSTTAFSGRGDASHPLSIPTFWYRL
ncbi:uncharacterized protein LOC120640442 isoform X19 [Panicum virgatum]|uniref:uncharacterized protein LOC120640442 isoform X19 n=1 Tax=Panicum virgatum TaxID=38727 RepID=UPI0019D56A89|nr:uncharacterized protein LOC120640442 isoform X19 [Panicum virgatum]